MAEQEAPAHVPGVGKGEEISERDGKEAGRYDTGTDPSKADRPTGTSTARDDTGIDPQEPVTGGPTKG